MQDQWIDWLQENRRNFFYGVLLVVAVFFIAFQVYDRFQKPGSRGHFVHASEAFEKWVAQGEAFERLEKALDAQPELETKFGALIADHFLAIGEADKAQPFADKVFARVFKHTPEHTKFAESSLLISQGRLKEALTQTVSLKETLDKDSLLYGFNLIRIAALYRALEDRVEEMDALQELDHYLAENKQVAPILNECFHEGDATLNDYISKRKQSI